MSYCRIGDNSDVYCYASEEGWEICTAANFCWYEPPLSEPATVKEMLAKIKSKPTGLPFAGETFQFKAPGEAADKLLELRGHGYRVPQDAIDRLIKEKP